MKAVIFDIDGTLTINQSQIFDNHKYALTMINPSLTPEEISSYLGKSIQSIALQMRLSKDEIHLYRKYYNESDVITVKQTRLVPNMIEVLKLLQSKSIPMGIVTSKLNETTFRLLDHLQITQYFDIIITSEKVSLQKPNPEGLRLACNHLGIELNPDVYFVGDTVSDVQASLSAGITPIAVLWGVDGQIIADKFGKENVLITKSVSELFDVLLL